MTTSACVPLIHSAQVWTCETGLELVRATSDGFDIPHELSATLVNRAIEDRNPAIFNREQLVEILDESDPLDGLLAIPVIVGGQVKSCVLLGIECEAGAMAALEIWKLNDREELALEGSLFVGLDRFAHISRFVRFPSGAGLPGQSWEDSQAKMITGLGTAPDFVRAAGALASGLDIGIALPMFVSAEQVNSVLLMLSATASPIARTFEIWEIDGDQAKLRAAAASDKSPMAVEPEGLSLARGEGIVGQVWESGQPFVGLDRFEVEASRWSNIAPDRVLFAMAYPVYVGERLESVFLMLQ